ncbi:MAG: hypothetical protein ABI333_26565 [bacterium]
MPLAHQSRSHGTVAFGFFNIETDMLLLEELFFFADDFCAAVETLTDSAASAADGPVTADIDGWRIPDRAAVGNLHGAIGGVDLSGFIGATYRDWPFPAAPEDFKQSPDGVRNQARARELIEPYGRPETLPLRWDRSAARVSLAEYEFDHAGFRSLLAYVERGGYPRWTADRAPEYVNSMMAKSARVW